MGTPISGYGPPTTKTRAQVGDFYIDQDSQKVYKCTAINPGSVLDYGFIDIHQGHDNEYEWTELFGDKLKLSSAGYFHYERRRLELLPRIDTKNCTDFRYMFSGCSSLTSIPELDTSNGVYFIGMFYNCSSLTSIPELDTSKGQQFIEMFCNCSSLTSIPELDTSNGVTFLNMFSGCSSLTSIPELDTSKGTMFMAMFYNCSSLTSIPELDTSKGQQFIDMFRNCSSLTNLRLYNIRTSLQIGSGTSWGHLLTVDSLVHTIKELCTVTTQQTLTMGSANLAKIADLYCRVTDDTAEKIEMELCESTDEGAMTLAEYAMLKNWMLA